MANPHPTPHTSKLPKLTCITCGETKRARRFPKKGGPTYEKLLAENPRRYDRQCKLCKKPRPSNPPPGYVHSEPKTIRMGRPRKPKVRKSLSEAEKRKRNREAKHRTRIATRLKSMQYLAKKGCYKCGEHDPRKLEYDHKDPATKNKSVSELITDGYPWSSAILREEICKCRTLCANCHRVHTIKQQGYYAAAEVKSCLRELAAEYQFKL